MKTANISLTHPLIGFPKEFQKGIWKSIDKRYLSILIGTAILSLVLLVQYVTQAVVLKPKVDMAKLIKKNPKIIGLTYEDLEKIDAIKKEYETTAVNENVKTNVTLKTMTALDRKAAYQNRIKQKVAERMQKLEAQMKNHLKKFESSGDNRFGFLSQTQSQSDHVHTLVVTTSNEDPGRSQFILTSNLLSTVSSEIDDPNWANISGNQARVELNSPGFELVKFSSSSIERKSSNAAVSVADISLAIASYENAVQLMYQKYLKNDPNLKGKIGVRIVFDSTGRVKSVTVTENSTGNEAFAQALSGKIKTWLFPKYARKGGLVTISQSFVFGK